MENEQRMAAEERLLELEWCALLEGPEGEDARRGIQTAEVYAVRNGTDLATAINAIQRMEESS